LTLTVKNWYYIFDRYDRWDILVDSLQYCKLNKDLKLYGFVFMLNHIHLIVHSTNIAGFIRDFKRYTSKKIIENIRKTEPNVLTLFQKENSQYQLWTKTNIPKKIESEKFFLQKLNYIHENPVRKSYVLKPEHWYWSSVNPDCELQSNCFEEL